MCRRPWRQWLCARCYARYWTNTFVKRDGIIAKAEFKYWSQGKVDAEKFEHETYSIDNKSSK